MKYKIKTYMEYLNQDLFIKSELIDSELGFDSFSDNICRTDTGMCIEGLEVESMLINDEKALIELNFLNENDLNQIDVDDDELIYNEIIEYSKFNKYIVIENPTFETVNKVNKKIKEIGKLNSCYTKYEINNGSSAFFSSLIIGVAGNFIYDVLKTIIQSNDYSSIDIKSLKKNISDLIETSPEKITLISASKIDDSWDFKFKTNTKKIFLRTDKKMKIEYINIKNITNKKSEI